MFNRVIASRGEKTYEFKLKKLIGIRKIKEDLAQKGYTFEMGYNSNKQHLCKYCYCNIVNNNYEDILCKECQKDFGHTLYSEL